MVFCSRLCKQFLLLVWKNFLLQIRRPIGTVFELVLPTLAVLFIIILKFAIFNNQREDRCFVTFDSDHLTLPSQLPELSPVYIGTYNIYYAPDNENTTEIMDLVASKIPPLDRVELKAFNTEDEMVLALQALPRGLLPLPTCFTGGAGVYFDNVNSTELEYTVRLRQEVGSRDSWQTRQTAAVFDLPGPRTNPNLYLSEGFLHIQNLVGQAIIDWRATLEGVTPPDVDISVRQLPYPPYTVDFFLTAIGSFLPLLLVMAFLYSAGVTVKELVLEKELRIRESMLMMGLQQWTLWSSWYLKQFIFLFVSVIFMSILLKFGQAFPNSDLFLLIIFFTLFITSMISFCFLVSVWFNSARIGLIVGFVAWFLNYMPVLFLVSRYDDLPLEAKLGACVLSNTCLGLGIQGLSILEQRGEGLTWTNAAQPLSADDSFSIAYVLAMLLLDTIVYMLVAWYVNGVKPGTYGVPKPFYFPCLPSYWIGGARTSSREIKEAKSPVDEEEDQHDPSAHEEVINPPEVGISIRNLTKIYGLSIFSRLFSGKKKRQEKDGVRRRAVDNFSLDMYKGHITALLGHNGAGKTTTMSILTGLYTPSDGTATISGYSILTDMDQIRNSLGICPQHNVLFDRLTVKEHLKFFFRLKGGSGNSNEEVEGMLEDLQLLDKRDIQASKLSGGMKRKLSVGIALIGGSDVVILDEPTSGMDPYARRATWDLLNKHKQNRTMLLTTHFMDEADLLGDRIAIMAEGKLLCSGSSLFLKSRYGVGYHMTIVKETTCDSSQVEGLIKSMVPQAEQVTDVGAELSFILPSNSTAQFPDLFDTLEARKEELGVASFGVSITTMEEVFMKVGEGTDETLDTRLRHSSSVKSPLRAASSQANNNTDVVKVDIEPSLPQAAVADNTPVLGEVHDPPAYDDDDDVVTDFRPVSQDDDDDVALTDKSSMTYKYTPNTGIALWLQQFYAIFLKRIYNSLRFYGAIVSQLVLPLIFVLFGLILIVTVPSGNEDDPKRSLGLDSSAISPENVSVFYAQFGDLSVGSSNLDFSDLLPSDLGATDLLNLTDQVQSIIDRVQTNPPTDIQDCCQYKYQLLDGFCASRTAGELKTQCGERDHFGYSRCTNCLSCCQATGRNSTLASCTSAYSLSTATKSNKDFCPTPPKTSATDSAHSGPLESENVYVTEHLLNVSAELQPSIFFRHYQAGFTIARRDPPISVCGCDSAPSQPEPQVCEFFSPLQPENASAECPDYSFNENSCASAWLACLLPSFPGVDFCDAIPILNRANIPGCSQLEPPTNATGSICNNTLPSCYSVDGLSADVLKIKACDDKDLVTGCSNRPKDNRPVGAAYPSQTPEIAATVWYNNQPYHMPAAALNTFHTILLRKVLGNNAYKITVNNHPLPRNATAQVEGATSDATGFGLGIMIVFGFSFLLASFVLFLVKEKESKAKHLQFVSGVFPSSYWLATFAWDLLNAFVPVIVSIILFAAFQVDAFSGEGLAAVFILLMLTCWSSIPFTYVFSFLFTNALAAFGILMLIFFFVAMLTLTVVFLVQQNIGNDEADIIHYIFLLFPTYGLSAAFNDIYINQVFKAVCSKPEAQSICANSTSIRYVDNPFDFSRPGIGIVLVYMAVEGLLLFILTILIERKFFYPDLRSLLKSKRRKSSKVLEYSTNDSESTLRLGEDSDVSAERRKIVHGETDYDDVVIINSLVKNYGSRLSGCRILPGKKAVRGISLAIPAGECFGLLGVNGAGKTTTFGIITGDLSMTSGTASIAGYDISTNLRDVQQRIGYCPQFDALIERLTGKELLTMFARLRGVPEKQIKNVVETEIARVDLKKYANKKCGSYSGGNKRKLSTAIALVGNPPIVLLDEPTTGMDPTTRRYTWDVLTAVIREGRSIILTSHSMEECEALCTRIAIMVNGSFKCLGSIQHLKNKYGAGFILQAKVKLSPQPVISVPSPRRKNRASITSPRRTGSYSVSDSDRDHVHAAAQIAQSPEDNQSLSVSGPAIGLDGSGTANAHNTTSLHIFIRESFTGAVLLEEHQGAVTYQLPSGAVSWSAVFRLLEENKERLGIVDYSVSQTTLEQVFINFAKEQQEDD